MVLVGLASAYSSSLYAAPLVTKTATGLFVAVAGDALAQAADPSIAHYDVMRGHGFAVFGASYTGAFQHMLFGWLEACIGTASFVGALSCMLFNQMLIIPTLYLPLFLLMQGVMSGLHVDEIGAMVKRKYFGLLKRTWGFWLPVQFATFALCAPEFLVPQDVLSAVAAEHGLRPVEGYEGGMRFDELVRRHGANQRLLAGGSGGVARAAFRTLAGKATINDMDDFPPSQMEVARLYTATVFCKATPKQRAAAADPQQQMKVMLELKRAHADWAMLSSEEKSRMVREALAKK